MANKNNQPILRVNEELEYKSKLSKTMSEMTTAKWWQETSKERQHNWAKIFAENEYAAEVKIASEFDRAPEPIDQKIKRIISEYDLLAKKYPL